jgi:D-alanyl-D-alanine carboxypeptidase
MPHQLGAGSARPPVSLADPPDGARWRLTLRQLIAVFAVVTTPLALTTSAAPERPATPIVNDVSQVSADLQALVERWVDATPAIPGLMIYVAAPDLGIAWSGAAGVADRATGKPLLPGAAFRIASTTKTFTAAAILRLTEDGRLGLDEPIAGRLPVAFVQELVQGGYDPDAITVRHLLLHTSGLYDYASDPAFLAVVSGDPGRRWTRFEQVHFAMEHGAPVGAPGDRWHYADTGYILLGEIIERVTGAPLGAAYRELLSFAALGLTHTYLEREEPAPVGIPQRAHQYLGDLDATTLLDPSADLYGGGGLVSTTEDLGRFYRALLRGEVFRIPGTLATMLAVPPTNEQADQAMGLFRSEIGEQVCWGHGGYWGNEAIYCPDRDVVLIYSPNQAEPGTAFEERFAAEVLAVVFDE